MTNKKTKETIQEELVQPTENPVLNPDQLAQFEPNLNIFKNIYYYGTVGSTNHDVEKELEQVFIEVTGRCLESWTCATCRKSNWYKLAKLYFDSLKYNEEQKNLTIEQCLISENENITD